MTADHPEVDAGTPLAWVVDTEQTTIGVHEFAARLYDQLAAQLERLGLDDSDDGFEQFREHAMTGAANARLRAELARQRAQNFRSGSLLLSRLAAS